MSSVRPTVIAVRPFGVNPIRCNDPLLPVRVFVSSPVRVSQSWATSLVPLAVSNRRPSALKTKPTRKPTGPRNRAVAVREPVGADVGESGNLRHRLKSVHRRQHQPGVVTEIRVVSADVPAEFTAWTE